ncbi:AIPR family protein [Nitrobacter sp. NHB1]|uniref:AIPR family protein n=1 Tax=Nitrobacter sp. NHB1 TaxID=3119830 RepID=UPI002FFFCF8B
MKIEEFKQSLRSSLQETCAHNNWSFDNAKQRGMVFEDWCFRLLSDRYPAADNNAEQCIVRSDDAGIDIFFESKETEEIYILQCKHPKIAASDPIPEHEIKSFFSNYELLRDHKYFEQRRTKNPKILELVAEFEYWIKQGYLIHFIFVSTGIADDKVAALIENFNGAKHKANVKFDVWDISGLRDEYVSVQSIEEKYPDNVTLTLAGGHFMQPDGNLNNLTFAIRGTALKDLALEHKDSLFNWNIRRFLGRKGEVNAGLTETLSKHPEHFYYFNNGISALCEEFHFEPKSKKLQITKLQVVNGAQTLGAIRHTNSEQLKDVLVLVKLTAVRHAHRETGIAASLIKTNNTQNTLRAPDFRSNDKIQLWLEEKFKSTKPRGEFPQIAYGRKRPYPRSSAAQSVLKLQDLGKIRYAWHNDPRIPISDPAKLFLLPEEGGLYGFSFGADGELVDIWSDDQFRTTLLAIHAFWKIESALKSLQTSIVDLRQISRLKYYGLKLFKRYCDQVVVVDRIVSFDELFAFGGKFNSFFDRSMKVISRTLSQSYRDMLSSEEGTAFSLPRDPKVWAAIERKFEDNLSLIRDIEG